MAGRIVLILILLSSFSGFALRDSTYTMRNGEKVYKRVQFKPEYQGGMDSLFAFLDRHLNVPASNKTVTVTAYFIVEKNGALSSIRIENAGDPIYSKEAERVLHLMPPWKPASHLGKSVACHFTMPISFETRK